MKLYLNATTKGQALKEKLLSFLVAKGHDVVDLTSSEDGDDVFKVTQQTVMKIQSDLESKAIIIDDYGIAPFIIANKYKHIICASVSDEQSSKMTRRHNNTNIIVLGSEIIGATLAQNCADAFFKADYDAGRHQIRIDMLNHMC
ncbi:RpiB/LacA/LacB family sugar-phosphate isomerase [Staphylococcus schleiferi subsp. coagulans]|uniref:RpiB/LacA/LacB family sugar-phosphate isomerase n=1 Tax=Staphylococcus coagulans TaxID=74706 RepID=UPI0015FB4CCF|nr:RpiB/LacA/LacB family sugar-phosphate isomerase [Staphylococcus coagulans]MBA8778410.1 RpiB/LacA/LacB family sugar-phosphate isomerase [Staphylococcus coagulans]